MDDLAQVLQEIQQRRRFLVTSHARPDGDAIGSTLALAQILRKMGKSAAVILGDPVPLLYHPLPGSETIVHSSQVNGDYDAVIILECDSVQRTRLRGLENQFLINIDHHVSSRPFANINWIDPSAVATAELIFRLAQAAQVKITAEIATCLYTAVLTDTGAFCYAPTNACTFEHILSPEVTDRICTFLGHPKTYPHGSPIPPGDCCGNGAHGGATRPLPARSEH